MKFYRVIMCTLMTNASGWRSLPTFYVHGVDCAAAKRQALCVAGNPTHSSGSLVAVDANLNALHSIDENYLSWGAS
jgi:hypothetical protein